MSAFAGAGFALVRAPARPRASAPAPPGAGDLGEYVRLLAAREDLREAVTLASPDLSAALDRFLARTDGDLVRLAGGLTGYALRMAHRPTPSGLLAGVAFATVGDTAAVRVGAAHRRHVRPDATWLLPLAARLEADPRLLATARLVADPTVYRQGDELVLPGRARATRIAATPHVIALLAAGATQAPYPALVEVASVATVVRLVQLGFLRSDLPPPPDVPDPLAHLGERLGNAAAPELIEIAEALHAPGRSLTALAQRMRELQPATRPLHVDLALDAEVRLPRIVVEEAARAAEALWRMSAPAAPDPLHARFLDRYGPSRVVPLAEVVGPLGPGPATGFPPATMEPARLRLLAAYLYDAVATGAREVVLDDEAVRRLSRRAADAVPASGLELYATLRAASPQALDAGEFRLAIGAWLGTRRVGASFGRLAGLFTDEQRDAIREAVRAAGPPFRATLVTRATDDEAANLNPAPAWLDHTIRIGVGPGPDDATEIPLAALGVTAADDRLRLVDLRTGHEVAPIRFDLLNRDAIASPAARFLDVLGADPDGLGGWDWGPLAEAPFLPRIRFGRTVLSPARWKPAPDLCGRSVRDEPERAWRDRFTRWRERVRLPAVAVLATDGQGVPLDLTDPLHLHLLRQRCARDPEPPPLVEVPGGEDFPDGWFRGPGGPHTVELVVPLLPAAPARPSLVVRASAGREVLPGGPWLSACLQVPRPAELTVLCDRLPTLLSRLQAEQWHFTRQGGLRLRFTGEEGRLWGEGLRALRDWTVALRSEGLAGELLIDAYRPGGLGGPDAHRFLTADSRAALEQLRLRRAGCPPPVVLAAAGLIDLVRSLGDADLFAAWAAEPVDLAGRRAFAACRRVAMSLIDPAGSWDNLRREPGGVAVTDAWTARRPALAGLRSGADSSIVARLVEMHGNRLFGTDGEAGRTAVAVARATLRAHADRARHQSAVRA